MHFKEALIDSDSENLFLLAPIPVWIEYFDDHDLHDRLYKLGLDELDDTQKRMGQELPEQLDTERVASYEVNYNRRDNWVEPNEFQPIGSRFFVPPNDFLTLDNPDVKILNERIKNGYKKLLDSIQQEHNENPKITESWMQYYDPYSGRGHNAHNHCRWQPEEATTKSFSGGYYLSDGEPILDHPYSGVFSFHVRGAAHFIRPKKGMLIIWPYDIVHSVKPFYGKSYRVVINFNIEDGNKIPDNLL